MCGCLSHTPYQRLGLQPRHVLWLGIEPATFWFTGQQHSLHWTTPGRADILYLDYLFLNLVFKSFLSIINQRNYEMRSCLLITYWERLKQNSWESWLKNWWHSSLIVRCRCQRSGLVLISLPHPSLYSNTKERWHWPYLFVQQDNSVHLSLGKYPQ